MRWQKRLRAAIAVFVVIFATFVVVSLRKEHRRPTVSVLPPNIDPKAVTQGGAGQVNLQSKGNEKTRITFGRVFTYEDGRSKFTDGFTLELPDKGGRQITVKCPQAEVTRPPGKDIDKGVFSGGCT